MTITETRPQAEPAAPPPVPRPATETWLTTGDHKRIGLLFLLGGLAAVLAGCVISALAALPHFGGTPDLWTRSGRLAGANTAVTLTIGIPALWIGLATFVVPLQLGATRLALPRLHALALWTYAAGAGLVGVGYLADQTRIASLASSAAATTFGVRATNATELLIAGLAIVAIATTFAAVSLLVTILAGRTAGMAFANMSVFSWSTLAVSSVLVLATPVYVAGLFLLWFDQHYAGSLFTTPGGAQVWQHHLWLLGRPEALLFAAAGVGLLTDVVVTHTRRPLPQHNLARAAAVAAALLTLLFWTQRNSVLVSPTTPTGTPLIASIGLAAGLVVLSWLGSFRFGLPKFHPSLVAAGGAVAIGGLAAVMVVAAAIAKVDEPARVVAFRNGQTSLLCLGVPLLTLAAGVQHWGPKLFGRVAPPGLASLQGLVLLLGVVLLAAPGYLVGFGGNGVSGIGVAGSVVLAFGLVLFGAAVVGGRPAPANPYGGLTLEWATPTPVPRANFELIPPIHSPYPLAAVDQETAR
jgi:cytochrome c oxidase subunit 1